MKPNHSRQRSLHWLLPMLGCLIFGGLGWSIAWSWDPRNFPVHNIVMEGTFHHINQNRLRAKVSTQLSDGLLALDVSRIRKAISGLAWVEDIKVWRQWPDTLRLALIERQALARWGQQELLSKRGDRFWPQPQDIPASLPQLAGPPGSERTVIAEYFRLVALLAPYGLVPNVVSLSQRKAWSCTLSDGPVLRLGRGEYKSRLLRFAVAYVAKLQSQANRIQTIDLRYTNGFSVRWNQSKSVAWMSPLYQAHRNIQKRNRYAQKS